MTRKKQIFNRCATCVLNVLWSCIVSSVYTHAHNKKKMSINMRSISNSSSISRYQLFAKVDKMKLLQTVFFIALCHIACKYNCWFCFDQYFSAPVRNCGEVMHFFYNSIIPDAFTNNLFRWQLCIFFGFRIVSIKHQVEMCNVSKKE